MHLNPGQTDSQLVASSHKLNLLRDLRWLAKRNGLASLLPSTRKSEKKNVSRHARVFLKHKLEITDDCYVFKFLRRGVKFSRHSVGGSLCLKDFYF